MLVVVSDLYFDIWCRGQCRIWISIFDYGVNVGCGFYYLVLVFVLDMEIDILCWGLCLI